MPVCSKCGAPMVGSITYRGVEIDSCNVCGINADVFVEIEVNLVEVDEDICDIISEMLLPKWLKGTWHDMSENFGMPGKTWFYSIQVGTLEAGKALAAILEESCDYPWSLTLTLVGSKMTRSYGGLCAKH